LPISKTLFINQTCSCLAHVGLVVNVEDSDPTLLAEGERNKAAQFNNFRFTEVRMQPGPKGIV